MKKVNIFKSTIIVVLITVISKAIGAFRDILISYKFGVSASTDAYKLSISIPDVIFAIIGLAISTTFIPMLSKIRSSEGKDAMNKFANNIINILLVISLFIFIIAMFFPEEIVGLIVSKNIDSETLRITINLTRIVLINILFLAVNSCFVAILQVNEDFIVPTVLGLFFNLPIILYLVIFNDFNVYGLTIANVIGNLLRIIVQIPSLKRNGFKYRFILKFNNKVREFIILIIPVIIGASANSINLIVDKRIASSLGKGVVTTLDNAQILVTVLTTMALTAISSVIYPILVNRINDNKEEAFSDLINKSLIYLAIFLVPITFGVCFYSKNIVEIVYLRGEYTSYNSELTTLAFIGYSIGIFFIATRDLLNSALFSIGETKITARNGIIGVVINILLSIFLARKFGIIGVAIASSIAMAITSILLLFSIIKLVKKFNYKAICRSIIKIIIATLGMAIVLIIFKRLTINSDENYIFFCGIILGVISYSIFIVLLRIKEVTDLFSYIGRKKR